MKKHVDPKAPMPLRMMAAKGLVPLGPADMVSVLFMLTFDADAAVRETAAKSASGLPDRVLSPALREERVQAPVLAWLLGLHAANDAYAELLILNAATPDEAVAQVAATCTVRTAEIIGQNQLRLLRHEQIIRMLCQNPVAPASLIDGVCDFAVRSGVASLEDVPQMRAARIRLFGEAPPPDPGPTAEEVMQEFQVADVPAGTSAAADPAAAQAAAAPLPEAKKLTLSQRVMKMNVSEKIKLATKGNKEARSILMRDTNKLVCTAVIRSPRITDGEVLTQAQNKTVNDDVLRLIYGDREWTKIYAVRLALVKNPKVPMTVAMKLMAVLQDADVKNLARDKNVPSGVQQQARRMVEKKEAPKPQGGGH
ncbi:MAG: hypothetical protein K1X89_25655 [Myxococcaceae bacterium]|nr:hypothetical protein [Myxococcaceae bacterium]